MFVLLLFLFLNKFIFIGPIKKADTVTEDPDGASAIIVNIWTMLLLMLLILYH